MTEQKDFSSRKHVIAGGVASFGHQETHQDDMDATRPHRTVHEPDSIIPVRMHDGSITPLRIFNATPGVRSTRRIIVFWPGFGVGASYYDPIAKELASRGFDVALAELHGQGDSTAVATRRNRFGYQTAAQYDYPTAIRAARETFHATPQTPVTLMAHSMGGQIGTLFLARPEAQELNVTSGFFIGSGSPYYKNFTDREYRRLRYGMPLMRAVSLLLGFWPGGKLDIAGYGRQSVQHIKEWSRFVEKDELHPTNPDVNYPELLSNCHTHLTLVRSTNDADCPPDSIAGLAKLLPNATITVKEIEKPYGHNHWARKPKEASDLLEEFANQLDTKKL